MRNPALGIRTNETDSDDQKTEQRSAWRAPRLRTIDAAEAANGGTMGDDGLGDFNS